MFETPAFKYVGQTSVFNLDEYIALRSNDDVTLHNAVQCPYGALSSKLTSWLCYKLDVTNMPAVCNCPRVHWFSDKNNDMIYARPPPTYGDVTYSRTKRSPHQLRAWRPDGLIYAKLAANPTQLNKLIIDKFLQYLNSNSTPACLTSPGPHAQHGPPATIPIATPGTTADTHMSNA